MNHKLAKELKDAGFPIRILGEEELGHMEDPDDCPLYIPTEEDEDGTVYYTPTLSELIEACGDGFARLSRHSDAKQQWYACAPLEGEIFVDTVFSWGTTPEEAVARLWLELNKKAAS